MIDPITEKCRQVRDAIVERAGGFEGYLNQLEELDRERLAAEAAKNKKAGKSKVVPKKRSRREPE